MIRIDTSGVAAFNKALDLELARLDREISAAFAGWTKRIFTGLVQDSPQYSGDMTANWTISLNTPDYSYSEIPNKYLASAPFANDVQGEVYQRGHPIAVAMALAKMSGVNPTWRDKVFFANATPIAEKIEAGQIALRPVNLVNGAVAMIQYRVDVENMRGAI